MSKGDVEFFPQSTRSGESRLSIVRDELVTSEVTADYQQFGYDYFDNPDLKVGYSGYRYDGRYADAVRHMCSHYGLGPGSRVLEVGCAKGYVLVEFHKLGLEVAGIDLSDYAVDHSYPDIKEFISIGDASQIPFDDDSFDFVLGKEVLPHLPEDKLRSTIQECMRVSRGPVFFEIQCGTTPLELDYMLRWDCTHKTVRPPEWWNELFNELGFTGDVHYKVLVPGGDQ